MISEAEINVIDRLLESLGNWAAILYIRGDLNGAMAVYNEQERICRELRHFLRPYWCGQCRGSDTGWTGGGLRVAG